jgi:VWFA-related protein
MGLRASRTLTLSRSETYTGATSAAPSHLTMRTSRLLSTALAIAIAAAWVAPHVAAQTRERTLFVSAVDEQGEPVEGLGPEAFVVRENRQRREILRVSRATEPIDIALLVDNSAAASDDVVHMREALSAFVAKMAIGNRIALIALADRPTVLVEYTSDVARLNQGIGRLFSMSQSGMTLLDGIYETARGLEKREGPRAVIVPVVTDGTEFTNRYSRDVVGALRRAGAALHAVTVGSFYHSEEHSVRERSFLLDEGPRASGGQRLTMLTPMALPATLQRLARELSSQYKIVYGRPDSLFGFDELEITSARPGITVRGTPARGEPGAAR